MSPPVEHDYLDEAQTRRMFELLDRQDRGLLDEHGERELRTLVDAYGRRFSEHHLRKYAEKQGISLEQAQHEADQRIARATAWLEETEADPRRRRAFLGRIKRRRSAGLR